jgi:hypothetical protein
VAVVVAIAVRLVELADLAAADQVTDQITN